MPVEVHSTLGALLIGLIVSCCLFGVSTVQAYIYYANFPKDRVSLKAMVTTVWLCELAHCICICHGVYYITVNEYQNPAALLLLPKSFGGAISLSGIIGTIVQIFLVERVRVVSGKLFISLLCWALALVRCGLTFLLTAETWRMHSVAEFMAQWKWLSGLVLALCSVVDLFLALSLCYYLDAQKVNGFRSTSLAIDKITTWTLQTGILTSFIGSLALVCFFVMPNNFIWLGIFMSLARVFSNTLLATLNGRTALREQKFIEFPGRQSTLGQGSRELMNVSSQFH
ncbi:hypothetical protein GALMADRAFT_249674 [Galerina marginata CBS 339.88]|uniref:DUF6534 domain-containing protein n=1 Tax=Galerina marginata (strain CBS 339.88) TaxID=685588 RepID=A0A067T6Z1_GALM3|nr:hypothetical protein GALMADRAFT_249674 [Galerina marginata CBS 339.88]